MPAWVKSGVQLKEALPLPLSVKMAPAGSERADRTGMVLSASVAEREKFKLTPSEVLCAPMAVSIGVWLPASLTEIETISVSAAEPSEA